MKKIATVFTLSLLAFGMNAQSGPSQGGNWQPLIITSGGVNTLNGVEANYELATSNGSDVVLIQLINTTTNPVKVTWKDVVITKDGQSHSGNNNEATTISPKIRVSDDIPNTIQITLKLSDFNATAANFKKLTVSDFDVISSN